MIVLPARDRRLLKDLAARMPCYRQLREGWYVDSCFDAERPVRQCCDNCRVLKRVQGRLAALAGETK